MNPPTSPASDPKPTERFSNRVEHYVKYRPGYPTEVLDCLRQNCGLTPQSVIADLGSGTGLLSELFLRHGNRVYGVEPNAEMRAAGEEYLREFPNFTSQSGTAEHTGLPAQSVHFITAGQAFHWFDRSKARPEFQRILKAGGYVVLIWGERRTDTPFLADYDNLLHRYSGEYEKVDHRQVTPEVVTQFFHPGWCKQQTFDYVQNFDWDGLRGRLLSSSYIPLEGSPQFTQMLSDLKGIYQRYAEGGRVPMYYFTKVYWGQMQ